MISPGEAKWRMIVAMTRDSRSARRLAPRLRALYRRDFSGLMIYVIQEGEDGPVKIGQTAGLPRERLATLQTGNSSTLRGVAAWRALPGEERFLHAMFAESRIRGEWFRPDPDLMEFVQWEGGIYCDWEAAA